MKAPKHIAKFDSATAMLRALANYLRGEDFPLLGAMPRWMGPIMRPVGAIVNRLPRRAREQVYIWSGWNESIAPTNIHRAKAEQVAAWMVNLYPERRYPAVFIGSSNGAAIHLCAALGVPWLPQTFLMPVARSGIHPDDPGADAEWAMEPARVLLESNPDIQLHHMHDPNQDRLMIQRMTYFRVKRLCLGQAYEDFLRRSLAPGGTIFLLECNLKWPTKKYGERHIFQFGALGGATPEEFLKGGPRVEDYLERYQSHREHWDSPAPDGERPEAEWGFEPGLRKDIERFAGRYGHPIRRIIFEEPEDLSPMIADFYRWWNDKRGIKEIRLLVESFILMEPYWTVRTGSIPFWMVFNKEPSARALASFLEGRDSVSELYMMLFSHGVESVGLVPIERWGEFLRRAGRASFIGVDKTAYPRDFAVFARYYYDLRSKITARYPQPSFLKLSSLDEFLDQSRRSYKVEWL